MPHRTRSIATGVISNVPTDGHHQLAQELFPSDVPQVPAPTVTSAATRPPSASTTIEAPALFGPPNPSDSPAASNLFAGPPVPSAPSIQSAVGATGNSVDPDDPDNSSDAGDYDDEGEDEDEISMDPTKPYRFSSLLRTYGAYWFGQDTNVSSPAQGQVYREGFRALDYSGANLFEGYYAYQRLRRQVE